MISKRKTKKQLLNEIKLLNDKIARLKKSENSKQVKLQAEKQPEGFSKQKLEEYQILADNASDWVYWIDPDGNWKYISPSVEQITGYSTREFINNPNLLKEIIHSEDIIAFEDHLFTDVKKQKADYLEFRIIAKSGDIRWINHSCNPVFNSDDEYIGRRGANRDITGRKLVEESLRQNEEKYRLLVDNAHDWVYWIDPEGFWKYISPSCERVTGYSVEEFVKRPNLLAEITVQEDRERTKKHLEYDKKEHHADYFEMQIKTKSGDVRWISHSCNPVFSPTGEYLGRRGANRDITSQKKAEEALRESQQITEGIINAIPIGVFWKDKDLVYLGGNKTFAESSGFSDIKDVVGKDDYQMGWHEYAEKYRKDDMEVIESGVGKLLIEETVINTEGNLFTVLTNKIPLLNADGKVSGMLGTFMDISLRKRNEQIQKVLYNISKAVHQTDNLEELISLVRVELGTLINTSNFYVALYDDANDIISLPFYSDEKDEHTSFPAGNTLTKYVITSGKPLLANAKKLEELKNTIGIRKYGTDPEIWMGVPLKVRRKIIGVLVIQSYSNKNIFIDSDMEMLEFVSEQIGVSIQRKQAEKNLLKALEKATESDRLKSAFLTTMSHELRTPLNAIIGFSEIICEDFPINDIVSYAKTINSRGIHLLKIVEDLFDITLIESGEIKIQNNAEGLDSILNETYELIKTEQFDAKKENINIELIIPPDSEELTFYTDKSKLKQILVNLLKNSLKFTHEGYIKFGYKIKPDPEKAELEFFVEDTGIGIPENKRESIFEKFIQVEDTPTKAYGGAGIGLSIARKLNGLLGGKIWLESTEGEGSIFYFTIPFKPVEEINKPKIKMEEKKPLLIQKNILIVEDDEMSFRLLEVMLGRSHINSIWVKDGSEAIVYCNENQDVDLVLMDINLPEINGYDATRVIKQFRPTLPIIAQTAYAIAGDLEKSKEAGCDDYISKPINRNLLLKLINKQFARPGVN